MIAASFFLWGILRSLDDLLVALFQAAGTLRYATAMQIHASFFSAYLVASIPAGYLLRRNGYRRLLVCSVMLMALGSAICAPALWTNSFQLCLIGVFIVALGIAVLQTTSNPCIGLLGPEHSATARLLLVQAFVTLGSALGPLTGLALFGGWTRSTQSAPLVFPGTMLAQIYGCLTLGLIALATLLWMYFANDRVIIQGHTEGIGWHLMRNPRLAFGGAAVFLYVGTEASILGHSIPYLSQQSSSLRPGTAAMLLSAYWVAAIAGRLCFSALLLRFRTRTLLQAACLVATLLLLCSIYCAGAYSAACLLATGFFNAAIFPCVFTLSVTGLQKAELPHASALLSTAICGGGLMPMVSGVLADHAGIAAAFVLPCLAYLFIAGGAQLAFPQEFHLRPARSTK